MRILSLFLVSTLFHGVAGSLGPLHNAGLRALGSSMKQPLRVAQQLLHTNVPSPVHVLQRQQNHGVFSWYSHVLQTHPLMTKSVTSGIVMAGGDVLCQYIAHRRKNYLPYLPTFDWDEWDGDSTFRTAQIGFLYFAPILHLWYGFLMRCRPTFIKVVLDLLVFLPRFVLFSVPVCAAGDEIDIHNLVFNSIQHAANRIRALLGSFNALLKGERRSKYISAKIQQVPTWVYLVTLSEVMRFTIVPARFQVLFSNIFTIVWSACMTYRWN